MNELPETRPREGGRKREGRRNPSCEDEAKLKAFSAEGDGGGGTTTAVVYLHKSLS